MSRVPTSLLTGFLGSGKTTLLTHWLRSPEFSDTAVIINEAGDVQIDGTLVGRANENVQVLEGGCVCCKVLDDLALTIVSLLDGRDDGSIPKFSRLVIETSGLADPGPISSSLIRDPRLRERVRLTPTITVFDGSNGCEHLEHYHEARNQIMHSGKVIITKVEQLDAQARTAAEAAARRFNPHAPIIWSSRGDPAEPPTDHALQPTDLVPAVACSNEISEKDHKEHGHHLHHSHSELHAHAFKFGRPIHGASLIEAIDLMEQLFEGMIVRTKSLFWDTDTDCGYIIHSVGGTIDSPEEISDLDVTKTGIVVFANSLSRDRVKAVIAPFVPLT